MVKTRSHTTCNMAPPESNSEIVRQPASSSASVTVLGNFNIPQPMIMTGNLKQNFEKFKKAFEIYLSASGLDTLASEDRKIAIFLNLIGDKVTEIYETENLVAETLKKVVENITQYFAPKKTLLLSMRKFFTRFQGETEQIDAYVTELKKLASDCEFGELKDRLVWSQLIQGVRDRNLQEKLLAKGDQPLKDAVDMCRAWEAGRSQAQEIRSKEKEEEVHVEQVKRFQKYQRPGTSSRRTSQNKQHRSTTNASKIFKCFRCDTKHGINACPAFNKKCNKCGIKNHLAVCCRRNPGKNFKQISEIQTEFSSESESDSEAEKYLIGAVNVSNSKGWFENIKINEQDQTLAKIDTGADIDVMSQETLQSLTCHKKIKIEKTSARLITFAGHEVKPLGIVNLSCSKENDPNKVTVKFYVTKEKSQTLLSRDTSVALNLIRRVENLTESNLSDPLLQKSKQLFEGIGCMPGEIDLSIDENVVPHVANCSKIPYAIRPKLKKLLNKLCDLGIISRVKHPTKWVNQIIVVEKNDGSLRICLNPKQLNKALTREIFVIPTLDDFLSNLNGKKIFSVLDMSNGFWHCKLNKKSSELCTFITPFGLYKFHRLGFGLNVSPQIFQRRCVDIFGSIPGVMVYFDDLIIAAETVAEHDKILEQVFETAKKFNIKFNAQKIKLRLPEVQYLGHVFSAEGLKVSEEKVAAIVKMTEPSNVNELQRFLGTVNYLNKHIKNWSEKTALLRQLLRSKNEWVWTPQHSAQFEEIKRTLVSTPVLAYYDVNKDNVIQCDASQSGLGACLMQEGHPVSYASRALTEAEQKYSQLEKELASICFAVSRFHNYVYGKKLIVENDHKPLVTIVNKKNISETTCRVQKMLLKLMRYNIEVKYIPGKEVLIADCLSRAYLNNGPDGEDLEVTYAVHLASKYLSVTDSRKKELKEATKKDSTLMKLKEYIKHGWPKDKKKISQSTRPYWHIRHNISEIDGLLFNDSCLIIPQSNREEILKLLHKSHQNSEITKKKARTLVYWPLMSRQIEDFIKSCEICASFKAKNSSQTLLPHKVPNFPWEKIGIDIMTYNQSDYLVVKDFFSKWVEIIPITSKTASLIISKLEILFATFGNPLIIVADNNPFGSQEFKQFGKHNDIKIVTSSPTYSQSNGMAESGVKIAKNLLKKCTLEKSNLQEALREYRNTILENINASPAELLMSRQLRTQIPVIVEKLKPRVTRNVRTKLVQKQRIQKRYFDKNKRVLKPFKKGEEIYVYQGDTQMWVKGLIVKKLKEYPRSYIVSIEGKLYRRNRVDLRKRHVRVSGSEEQKELEKDKDNTKKEKQSKNVGKERSVKDSNVLTRPKRKITKTLKLNDYV